MTPRRSPIAAVPALLLVVVSLWEVCATRRDAGSVPGDQAWHEAATAVRAGYRPGDLIVFAPEWVDPVGRLHLGDLIPVDVAARMDGARFARIWEVAIRGAHAPETAGLEPISVEEHDGVTVRRFERTPVHVLADVRELLATVKIEGTPQRGATVELAEVGFQPHRCIEIVPAPGKPVRLTFPALALGSQLVGWVGLADVFTRRDIRAPATFEIEIGGAVVASATPGVDDGWVRFAAATKPGTADVTFVVRADVAQRLVCFAAEARE